MMGAKKQHAKVYNHSKIFSGRFYNRSLQSPEGATATTTTNFCYHLLFGAYQNAQTPPGNKAMQIAFKWVFREIDVAVKNYRCI
jgi:hypothetical protein